MKKFLSVKAWSWKDRSGKPGDPPFAEDYVPADVLAVVLAEKNAIEHIEHEPSPTQIAAAAVAESAA